MSKLPIASWRVYWSPEGRCIAIVLATTARQAIRKAPKPYRRYLGELYAEQIEANVPDGRYLGGYSE